MPVDGEVDFEAVISRKFDAVVSNEFRDPPDFARPLTGAKPWQS